MVAGETLQSVFADRIAQGLAHGIIIKIGGKDVCLPAQLGRGMAVGIGNQAEAIKSGNQPIHIRIGRKASLQGENVVGKVAETLLHRIKTRSGTEQGKPWGPDMGRHQEPFRRFFKNYFQKISAVEPQNGPAVRLNIADSRQGGVDPPDRIEIRGEQDIMYLAHRPAPLVNRAYLGSEDKTDRRQVRLKPRGQQTLRRQGRFPAQPEKSGFGFHKLLKQLPQPSRMGEIAGAQQPDALNSGPGRQTGQMAIPAGGPGKR